MHAISDHTVRHDAFRANVGVDRAKLVFRSHGFGQGFAGVCFIEQGLPLEVGGFDEISIDNAKASDSRANQEIGRGRPDCSTADQDRASIGQALLTLGTKGREQHLPRIFLVKSVVHVNYFQAPDTFMIARKAAEEATRLCCRSSD